MSLMLGRGGGDFSVSDGEQTLHSGWSAGGKVISGRVGYAVTRELLVAAEYGVWRRFAASSDSASSSQSTSDSILDEPVDRYLGMGLLTVSLYPRVAGFFLRGGLGYGRSSIRIEQDGQTMSADEFGMVILMGLGYEHAIDDDLSLAFYFDTGRFEGGGNLSGNFTNFTAAATMYMGKPPE